MTSPEVMRTSLDALATVDCKTGQGDQAVSSGAAGGAIATPAAKNTAPAAMSPSAQARRLESPLSSHEPTPKSVRSPVLTRNGEPHLTVPPKLPFCAP